MSTTIQTEQDLTEAEKFHCIIHDIYTNARPHEDKKDNSNHPSYRKFKLPYHVQCAHRYEIAKRTYEDQFQREIDKLIALQSSGYEAARMNSSSDRQIYGLPLSLRLRSGLAQRKPKSTSSQRKNLLEGSMYSSYSAADSDIDWNAKKGAVSEDYNNLHLSFRNFDSNDNSIDGSYTNALGYDIVCRTRYKKNFIKYNEQFRREIEQTIENQEKAYEAAIYTRVMSYTTLWPRYHSRAEINISRKGLSDNLTRKQRLRLQFLMEHEIQ
uniref:Uncharacterized protein n=1 Tax=Glossina austeni TaxID=7395 RepID=A0A1A9VW90_GLOAU